MTTPVRKVRVVVKPGSKVDAVEEAEDGLVVCTKARAVDGKANEAVIKLLAKHFDVPKTTIRIKTGIVSRTKIVEIC
jgi:uncharacterized protein YggU (UPF0235/DUF167 family)